MKTPKSLFGILTITLALAAQAQAQSFLTNGLVAYYPFNGNANDESGNGHNLANVGATLCADRFGNTNAAYAFNGSSYLGASTPPLTQIDNCTLTAWIQLASLNQNSAFAVCLGQNAQLNNGFGFGVSGGGYGGATGSQLYAFYPGTSFAPDEYEFNSTTEWSQVVMVRSSDVAVLFVNGLPTTNTFSTMVSPPTSFEIGSAGNAYPLYFTGAVDDVRVYNRALSSNEVQELFGYESVPSPCVPHAATATAIIANGFVVSAAVTDGGCGYTDAPLVLIMGGGGTGATATAVVSNGLVVGITITDAGSGYTNAPTVDINAPACIPYTATATATVVNGFVVGATITDGGCGYTNTPTVRFIGGGGSGAQAVAVESNGMVIAINLLNAGFGYTNGPQVVIEPPFISSPTLSMAPMSLLTFSNLTIGGAYQLQQFEQGYFWTNQPTNFTTTSSVYTQMVTGVASSGDYRLALNPLPAQAFAVADVVNGFVVGATVTSGGSGYVTNPPVSIETDDGGTNATAVSQISASGVVTNIVITSAGIGYTNTPTIEIGPPPAAAVSPAVQLVMQVNSASLAPYDNYQIQFAPTLGTTWENWNGGLFRPTDVTNTQFLFVTNSTGFYRLVYVSRGTQ
jgi:hypothetical protein